MRDAALALGIGKIAQQAGPRFVPLTKISESRCARSFAMSAP